MEVWNFERLARSGIERVSAEIHREFPKVVTPRERCMQEYHRICQEEYSNRQKLYTDGSKRDEGVGAAVVWERRVRMATLPRGASIFSAELHAIIMAVQVIGELEGERFVIMSDSCSVLESLGCVSNRHPVCRKINHKIDEMKEISGKDVCFCCILSHIGIKKNEEADIAAVAASR